MGTLERVLLIMHLKTFAMVTSDTHGKYIFDSLNLMTLMLLYGVEVWGRSIPTSTWKELENIQKHFLTKIL